MGRAGGSWALGAGRASALQARGTHGAGGGSGRRARDRRTLGRRAAGARQQRAGRAGNGGLVRGQARRGRTVRAGHGWPGRGLGAGWVKKAGPAGPVLVHCAPGSVLARFFDPVSTRYFPKSPNEHCSL